MNTTKGEPRHDALSNTTIKLKECHINSQVTQKNNLVGFLGIFLVSMLFVPTVSAQEATIPDWIKNNAGWWADGQIDDSSFVSGLQWLISNGIIMMELEVVNEDLDEEGRLAGGILTGQNCSKEIDRDGDKVPDNLDAEGSINWSHCTVEGRDLSGANLSGANLYGVELDNTDLSGADLSYSVLYKATLANTDFTGANLSYANLCGATNPVVKIDWPEGTYHEPRYLIFDFTGTDMSYADFDHAQIQHAVLTDAIVEYTNFHDANLEGVDLSYKDLTGTILTEADLTDANLAEVDLSGKDLTGTILKGANLTDANLDGVDLSGRELSGAILRGIDLSDKDLTGTILKGADLTNTILPSDILSGNDFQKTIFDDVNLSGKDLSWSSFWISSFKNTNLENTNLNGADLRASDLTKIKNKSLAGADLTHASFVLSNLSGINIPGVTIAETNFSKAELSGLDFTVTSTPYYGTIFAYANLSHSNFESVNLSPEDVYTVPLENKAHLENLQGQDFVQSALGEGYDNVHIVSKEVIGNDLIVSYVLFNNFNNANLENVNFKNAILWLVNFHSANLANADLSGADLTKAILKNANLTAADLSGVVYDDSTILTCVGHPICV